jgi:hypothetical protein
MHMKIIQTTWLMGAVMSSDPFEAFDTENKSLLVAAGLAVPADLLAGVLSEARAVRRAAHLLRQPRSAAHEPSNIFSIVGYSNLPPTI